MTMKNETNRVAYFARATFYSPAGFSYDAERAFALDADTLDAAVIDYAEEALAREAADELDVLDPEDLSYTGLVVEDAEGNGVTA